MEHINEHAAGWLSAAGSTFQRHSRKSLEHSRNSVQSHAAASQPSSCCDPVRYCKSLLDNDRGYFANCARFLPHSVKCGEEAISAMSNSGGKSTSSQPDESDIGAAGLSTNGAQNAVQTSLSTPIAIVKSSKFGVEAAKRRIRRLNVAGTGMVDGGLLTTLFPPDALPALRATGGLIGYLHDKTLVNSLESDSKAAILVTTLSTINFDDVLSIDMASMAALDIFTVEQHPSCVKGRGRAKEGFSLYALLNRTRSTIGNAMLRDWMMRPLRTASDINARLNVVQTLAQPSNAEHVSEMNKMLAGCKDARR